MLGPMIANTIAAVLGAPVAGPQRIRPVVIPISSARSCFKHWVPSPDFSLIFNCWLTPLLTVAAIQASLQP
jgi:hypothetical protein